VITEKTNILAIHMLSCHYGLCAGPTEGLSLTWLSCKSFPTTTALFRPRFRSVNPY